MPGRLSPGRWVSLAHRAMGDRDAADAMPLPVLLASLPLPLLLEQEEEGKRERETEERAMPGQRPPHGLRQRPSLRVIASSP